MHDTVTPFIETMGTAINRHEAAIPPRPEGTGLPGRNPVKHSYSILLNFGNGRNVSRETFRPNSLYRYTGNKRAMSGLKIDGSAAYNILNLPFAT